MNRITVTILLLLLTLLEVNGQTIVTDLYGFRLGQYRKTATNELGKPVLKDKFEDNSEYEVFLVKPDTSLYMVFEYAAGQTNIIWSIQISGIDTTVDIDFKGLRFGTDKKQIEQILGKPDMKEDLGNYGERWNYKKANYSIEISKSGKLSSVKIEDINSDNRQDISKILKFEDIVKLMNSNKNAEIGSVLAPGIEIYYKGKALSFEKSLKTEIQTDYSKIFQTIREISKGLEKINISDPNSYEESMRLVIGQNPKHVIKIKTGHTIKEIVFDYMNGQYLIWEINAR